MRLRRSVLLLGICAWTTPIWGAPPSAAPAVELKLNAADGAEAVKSPPTNELRSSASDAANKPLHNALRDAQPAVAEDDPILAVPLETVKPNGTSSRRSAAVQPTPATTKPTVTQPVETESALKTEVTSTAAASKTENSTSPPTKNSTAKVTTIPSDGAQTPTSKPLPSTETTVLQDRESAGERLPNRLLNRTDDEPSKRAAVANRPAEPATKKLFESTTEAEPLSPQMEALRRRVQTALAQFYQNWTLNTVEHSPWEVMHAIIAYGVDTRLVQQGRTTTAIGHLCYGGVCNKQSIVTLRDGRLYVLRGPGVQGHSGQFLAMLAQSHLQRDYPLYVGGRQYTLEDLIRAEQEDCESGTELTFKLIGLMHYLPGDAEWENFQGQKWSLDRLVREEIVQPIRGAACGGTHRLMGLSYAVRKREQRGEPVDGVYLEARKYLAQYHQYTRGLQNSDGSLSTAWFVRRESRLDLDRRLQTTGHMLEWLCFSLPDEQLREPWVIRSVKYVSDLLLDIPQHEWEIGHLGHALHALQLYNERVFGGPIRSYESLVTRRPTRTTR